MLKTQWYFLCIFFVSIDARTVLQDFYSTLRSQKTSSGGSSSCEVTSLCVLDTPMNAYSEN